MSPWVQIPHPPQQVSERAGQKGRLQLGGAPSALSLSHRVSPVDRRGSVSVPQVSRRIPATSGVEPSALSRRQADQGAWSTTPLPCLLGNAEALIEWGRSELQLSLRFQSPGCAPLRRAGFPALLGAPLLPSARSASAAPKVPVTFRGRRRQWWLRHQWRRHLTPLQAEFRESNRRLRSSSRGRPRAAPREFTGILASPVPAFGVVDHLGRDHVHAQANHRGPSRRSRQRASREALRDRSTRVGPPPSRKSRVLSRARR